MSNQSSPEVGSLKSLQCSVHSQPAVYIDIKERNSKKTAEIRCLECELFSQLTNPEKEGGGMLRIYVDHPPNISFHLLRRQSMSDEIFRLRGLINYNRLRLQRLGESVYRYLEGYSYDNIRGNKGGEKAEEQERDSYLDSLFAVETSQFTYRELLTGLVKEGGSEESLDTFASSIFFMQSKLKECKDICEESTKFLDFSDKDVTKLFGKITKLINETLQKKNKSKEAQLATTVSPSNKQPTVKKKKTEKKPRNFRVRKRFSSKIIEETDSEDQESEPTCEETTFPQQFSQDTAREDYCIVGEDTKQLLLSTTYSSPPPPPTSNGTLSLLESLEIGSTNKVFRLRVSPDESELLVCCGGWQKSSGRSLLVDISQETSSSDDSRMRVKKQFVYESAFIDGVFTPCGGFVCLTTYQCVCLFSTEVGEQVDRFPVLKILTMFDVRAIEIFDWGSSRRKRKKKQQQLLAFGGDKHFQMVQMEKEMMSNAKNRFLVDVAGQIDTLKFSFNGKFVALAVFEARNVQLYDVKKNEICDVTEPLNMDIWAMQEIPEQRLIAVAGSSQFILLLGIQEVTLRLVVVQKIRLDFVNKTVISLSYSQNLLCVTVDDHSIQVYELGEATKEKKEVDNDIFIVKAKKLAEYQSAVVKEKGKVNSPLLYHLLPSLVLAVDTKQMFIGCQRGFISRWSVNKDFFPVEEKEVKVIVSQSDYEKSQEKKENENEMSSREKSK